MPIAPNLLKAFEKGILRILTINANQTDGPATGKYWLILDGTIYHTTGTASGANIVLTRDETITIYGLRMILAATASGSDNLFSIDPTVGLYQSQWVFKIVSDDMKVAFQGGAGAHLNLAVLEWTP